MRGRLAAGLQRTISAGCLAAYLAGCTGWHEVATLTPPPISDRPQSLRVTLTDGGVWELRNARIVGDSVIGQTGALSSPERTVFAVHDIKKLDDRQVLPGNTAMAFFGILLLVGGAFLAAGSAMNSFP